VNANTDHDYFSSIFDATATAVRGRTATLGYAMATAGACAASDAGTAPLSFTLPLAVGGDLRLIGELWYWARKCSTACARRGSRKEENFAAALWRGSTRARRPSRRGAHDDRARHGDERAVTPRSVYRRGESAERTQVFRKSTPSGVTSTVTALAPQWTPRAAAWSVAA
jgi:hypothetical protein